MAKILVLFAHPALEKSRVHSSLVRRIEHMQGITFHDLYQSYPDFYIDVKAEQQLLLAHDIFVWQHPFYWYNGPAMIKQWLDLVLEHGWAYGSTGNALTGKMVFNAISTGGSQATYTREGRNGFTIKEFLSVFSQTAQLCNMKYLPPFVIHGTHRLIQADIELYALQYEQLLLALVNDRVAASEYAGKLYLNDIVPIPQPIQS